MDLGRVRASQLTEKRFLSKARNFHAKDLGGEAAPQRPVFFSPEDYPRYVGTDRGNIPEYYPRKDPITGELQTSFEAIGYISQVPHTFAYLEETYGAVNEMQLGIGESTCSGVFGAIPLGAPNGTALFSVDELTHIAMERTSTAREAVQLMGDLAVQYGFYGAGEFEGTAESLAVSDTEEAWIFHVLPDPTGKSAIWAAQKVPSNGFAVLANMFVIRQVDPADTENFLMSESVHTVAEEYGWWESEEKDGLLDFTKVYSDGEYAHKFYSGRRMWGAYHLAAPSLGLPADYVDLQSDPVYPVFVEPDQKISAQDLFRFHRYTYQGTEFDLGAEGNLAGGPFGTPDRWKAGEGEKMVSGNWERAIGLYRTSDTYIVQSKKNNDEVTGVGAVLWFGPASALGTVFTPFVVGMSDIPSSFRSGIHAEFSRQSAFWAACTVHNIANLKWNFMIQDILKAQEDLETSSVALMTKMLEGDTINMEIIEAALVENADRVTATLWQLSDQLIFKYASGFVNEVKPNGLSQMVGYPAWWLQAVGYQNGPPPPPTTPKCCNPKPQPVRYLYNTTMDASSKEAAILLGRQKLSSTAELTGKAAMRKYLRTIIPETSKTIEN